MNNVKQITVNADVFNFAMASAEKQLDLYEMLFSRLLYNAVSTLTEEINANVIKGLIASGEAGMIKTIADIVLESCVYNGTETRPTIRDFQGRIDSFVTLVAEGVVFNLKDFFFFIENQVMQIKQENERQKAEAEAEQNELSSIGS